MTKKQLIDLLSAYPDNAEVVIEVHDTMLAEDLYDFTLDPISWTKWNQEASNTDLVEEFDYKTMYELRLCAINHHEKQMT
jgi:hypothetical protein